MLFLAVLRGLIHRMLICAQGEVVWQLWKLVLDLMNTFFKHSKGHNSSSEKQILQTLTSMNFRYITVISNSWWQKTMNMCRSTLSHRRTARYLVRHKRARWWVGFLKSWRPAHNAKHVVLTYFIYSHDIFICKVPRKFQCTWLSESKTAFLSCRRKYRSISPLIISWNCSRLNSPCSPRSRPLSGTQIFAFKFNRSVKITSFKIKNKRNEK